MSSGSVGSLDLKPAEDISVAVDSFNNVFGEAMEAIRVKGLTLPSVPANGYRGDMPSDLSHLDDESLGNLLYNLSSYLGFVQAELVKARCEMDISNTTLDQVRAQIRNRIRERGNDVYGKLAAKDKDDLVEIHPDVVAAKRRALYTEAINSFTHTIRDMYQRHWETVSRRITQRGQEIDRMKREGYVSSIPNQTAKVFRRRGG